MNFNEKVESLRDDIIKTTQEFIRVKSVKSEPKENMPFGEGVDNALKWILNKSEEFGFNIKNVDNYGGHAEIGSGEKVLGILAHVDVVPEGNDWTYPPYAAEIHNDKIYGRGTIDDKGPLIAALFAMKVIKDSGIKLNTKVRAIFGTDEESGWDGINYYFSKEKAPDFGFTPDADFPVIHGEKGIVIFNFNKKFEECLNDGGIKVLSIKGGNRPNMVPDYCEARLIDTKGFKHILDAYNKEKNSNLVLEMDGEITVIKSYGVSAHGSLPESGVNAISLMLEFLNLLDLEIGDLTNFIRFYSRTIGMDYYGERIGCDFEDIESGKLIFNVGVIDLNKDTVTMAINIRYPITINYEDVINGIKKITNENGITLDVLEHKKPIYIPKNNELIIKLMDVYREETGDIKSEPITIGGGTYARSCPNIVAFGPLFPEEEELAHQKNEFIGIDELIKMTKIYTKAIYELTK
ncbi:dipeptidase PepV [Helicovermis profundi]|uniref:Dipeptidase PepV n=1 Tax=Helicovermis profundi TaxID=3065157 RepID=A0AAU9EN88_9FIRM|nr:dipeptidase PepV [Clostridia bacterium S502]